MAKLTGALLSFGSTGQIGKTMVVASWRGVPYARQYVVPANPQTTGQTTTRNTFRTLEEMWKLAPTLLKAPWDLQAKGQKYVGRNAWVGENMKAIRGETDLLLLVGSPGAKGGLPPSSISLTAGSGEIQVDFTNPDGPEGWTLDSAIAAAVPDQDPAASFTGTWTAGEDDTTQNQVILTGLSTDLHVVVAWLKWTKADGSTAYSPSLLDSATPTA
jgi:hypothetical protein